MKRFCNLLVRKLNKVYKRYLFNEIELFDVILTTHCNWRTMFTIITIAIIMFLSKYNKIKMLKMKHYRRQETLPVLALEMVILGLRDLVIFILPHSKNPNTSNFTSIQATQYNGKSKGFGINKTISSLILPYIRQLFCTLVCLL